MADVSPGPEREEGLESPRNPEEPPPVGGSWRLLYGIVLAALAAQVLLYAIFARAFR